MQNHLRILGWIYIVTCGLTLALGLMLCVALNLDPSSSSQKALQFIGPPILLAACFGLIPGLAGGIGLLRSRPWARILLLLASAVLLPLLPVGTALGIYGFWTLLNPQTQTHFAGGKSASSKPSLRLSSPFLNLMGVMACVAAGFFLVLKVGFVVHHDSPPAPIDSTALTATAVLILFSGSVVATLRAIRSCQRGAENARMRKNFQGKVSAQTLARQRRAEELAADPARAQYAPRVERGENWSDEQITYHENPEITVTCVHLQAIERAMRDAGIKVLYYKKMDVTAQCRIDSVALQRAFHADLPVRYAEFYQGDPESHEHPAAFLICEAHHSMIHTLHPEISGAQNTPLFPAINI